MGNTGSRNNQTRVECDHSPGAIANSMDSYTHWLLFTGGGSKWVPYTEGTNGSNTTRYSWTNLILTVPRMFGAAYPESPLQVALDTDSSPPMMKTRDGMYSLPLPFTLSFMNLIERNNTGFS